MTETLDEHGRRQPPLDGREWETLTGFLDFHRATFAWKTAGLDASQLSRQVAPSAMADGGMAFTGRVTARTTGVARGQDPTRPPAPDREPSQMVA